MRTGRTRHDESGRGVLEALLVIFFVSAVLVLAIERYTASISSIRENAMRIELSNLRSAVTHYAMIKRKLPDNLRALASESMEIPQKGLGGGEYKIVFSGKFVEAANLDDEGYPLDPFGNRYGYAPESGRVWSTTPGYAGW